MSLKRNSPPAANKIHTLLTDTRMLRLLGLPDRAPLESAKMAQKEAHPPISKLHKRIPNHLKYKELSNFGRVSSPTGTIFAQ